MQKNETPSRMRTARRIGSPRAIQSTQVLLVQRLGFWTCSNDSRSRACACWTRRAPTGALVGQLEDLTAKDVKTRLANRLVGRCASIRKAISQCAKARFEQELLGAA